jgi:hypothetical protein
MPVLSQTLAVSQPGPAVATLKFEMPRLSDDPITWRDVTMMYRPGTLVIA